MKDDKAGADTGCLCPCPYERVMLSRVGACSQATSLRHGERRRVTCGNEQAQHNCVELLNTLRKRANFTLGLTRNAGALRLEHATKLQCGGLLGLQHELDQVERQPRIEDIHALVNRALRRFGSWADLPVAAILRDVAAYRHERLRRQRRKRG